jgi:hypothetical protein
MTLTGVGGPADGETHPSVAPSRGRNHDLVSTRDCGYGAEQQRPDSHDFLPTWKRDPVLNNPPATRAEG